MDTRQIYIYKPLLKKALKKRRAEWTLDDWVMCIHSIYGERNAPKSPMEIWLHVTNDASQLSEEVRKGKLEEVVRKGTKMFGRICGFVGKYLYQKEFSENDPINTCLRVRSVGCDFIGGPESYGKWILEKYPSCCGTCWEFVCMCSAYRPIMENRNEKSELYDKVIKDRKEKIRYIKRNLSKVNGNQSKSAKDFLSKPLDKLIDNFFQIYGGSHFDLELWKIAAHLMEEVGEVANEILNLADINQAKADDVDFTTHIKNAIERAQGDERGLNEALTKKIQEKLAAGSENTLAYFKEFIAQTMRGELADVMSWLSALLWKIGEMWRSAKEPKTGEQPQYYDFSQHVNLRYTGMQENLACSFCEGVECKEWCRSVTLIKNVTKEMNKSVTQCNLALLATLGLSK